MSTATQRRIAAQNWTFEVLGEPVPWQRARASGAGRGVSMWTDPAVARAKRSVVAMARQAGVYQIDGPVIMDIAAMFSPPASWTKRKRLSSIGAWKATRPDDDNIAKLVRDALNGVAYRDDGQIVAGSTCKIYGLTARTVITVRAATPADLPAISHAETRRMLEATQ